MSNQRIIPAVVTPLDEHMGLDIARTLYAHGIPVYGLDPNPGICGRHSKACKYIKVPDLDGDCSDFVRSLVEFSQQSGCKPVLFPLSDEVVLAVSRNRRLLSDYYHFVMPDNETIENLSSKDGLQWVANEHGISSPATYIINSADELENLVSIIKFPIILKPGESSAWHDPKIIHLLMHGIMEARAKVVLCNEPAELFEMYNVLASICPRLVIQEVIPGEDSRLYYCSFYMNRQSKPLAIFAGRKDRVVPVGFGSASFVHSYYDQRLIDVGLKLLTSTRYQGLVGIEFKKDSRDEEYKLIEVNTRFGMWDGLGARCGVEIAYIAYCDALGIPIEPSLRYREGVIWFDWQRDFRAAVGYHRLGKLSWIGWLRSLRGEKMWAIYNRNDPLPGLYFTIELLQRFTQRISNRIISKPNYEAR